MSIPAVDIDSVDTDALIFDPLSFSLTEQQIDLSQRARTLGQSVFAERAFEIDRDARFPTENYVDLKNCGVRIAKWISGRVQLSPTKIAIIYEDQQISYAELDRRIIRIATVLAGLGVKAFDRVAILEYNTPDYIALLFACGHLGAILVPLNWRLTPAEHQWQLEDCKPVVLVCGGAFVEHVQSPMEITRVQHWLVAGGDHEGFGSIDQPALEASEPTVSSASFASAMLLVYTSGTTGFPKGAVLTQSALFWCCVNSQQVHQLTSSDTVLLHNRFDPERAFDSIEKHRPSIHLGVPPTMQALIDHPRWQNADLSSIRLLMAGSSVVPMNLLDACFDRGITTGQVYGSTETGPLVIALDVEHAHAHRGSCGKPPIHCNARIVSHDGEDLGIGESGEIVVRGPNLFSGYWKNETATSETMLRDWFRTGDIGHVDEQGFFYVDDRKKDVIISGGENVYPAEVENALGNLAGVRELAIVGKAHERWGEVPVAVVVPEDHENFDSACVVERLEGRIARYKMPQQVIIRDALPRNAMGKVLKYKLREWLSQISR